MDIDVYFDDSFVGASLRYRSSQSIDTYKSRNLIAGVRPESGQAVDSADALGQGTVAVWSYLTRRGGDT